MTEGMIGLQTRARQHLAGRLGLAGGKPAGQIIQSVFEERRGRGWSLCARFRDQASSKGIWWMPWH